MKQSLTILFLFLLVVPNTFAASEQRAANRAWRPFFTAFRVAVRKHDRVALRKMMSDDFFSSPGNDAGFDAAFKDWDDPHVRGWEALNRVVSQGTVPMAAWWGEDADGKHIIRIAPPAANVRRNIDRALIDWYAFFEFRDGRWYFIIFSQCCD